MPLPSAQLVQRSKGLIDLMVRSQPIFVMYRFAAATTLDDAFTAPVTLFDVQANTQFISRSLRLQRLGFYADRVPKLTRATFDLDDFASPTVPGDGAISYITVAGQPNNAPFLSFGPILVVPPPGFFSTGRRVLNLVGTAPNVGAGANNLPPPGVMNVILPRYADEIHIFNTGANPIFVSFGEGLPEYEIPSAGTNFLYFRQAGVQQLFLRASGGTSAFKVAASIVNGIPA